MEAITNTTRREFLRHAGGSSLAAAALAAAPAAFASPAPPARIARPTLVAVYLRGGADPLSAIVPYHDPEYPRHRPTLALLEKTGASAGASLLPLNDTFAFNANLKPLHALYEKGLCVPIVAVGSPHGTRSHFDAQDFMERGAPGAKNVGSGWLNRYLQATRTAKDANLRAVSLQPLLPRSLRGDYPVLAKPEQKAEQAMGVYAQLYLQPRSRSASPKPPSEAFGQQTKQAVQEFGTRTIEQLWELTQILEAPAGGKQYPTSPFGRQLQDTAKLIKAQRGLEITAIDYGGWDHHINLGPVDGQMGRQLADVANSIGAFVEDLGPQAMKQVLILVMSEFGRTVKENKNGGTDHGHGGFMLAIGGRVRGKNVYGKWTGLDDANLYERRDLPVLTDFRVVFAEALQGMFRFDGINEGLFPAYRSDSPPLNLMQTA